jgi:hypothetical protein
MTIIVRERVPSLSSSALCLSCKGKGEFVAPGGSKFGSRAWLYSCTPEFSLVIDWLDGWISIVVSCAVGFVLHGIVSVRGVLYGG